MASNTADTFYCPMCKKDSYTFATENDTHVIFECTSCKDIYCQYKPTEQDEITTPVPLTQAQNYRNIGKSEVGIQPPLKKVRFEEKETIIPPKEEQKEVIVEPTTEIVETVVHKKQRRKKDPDAPKKPRTSYMYFCQDLRPKIISQNPSIKFGTVTEMIAKEWQKQTPETKKPFEELARIDKERYAKEKEQFQQSKVATKVVETTVIVPEGAVGPCM